MAMEPTPIVDWNMLCLAIKLDAKVLTCTSDNCLMTVGIELKLISPSKPLRNSTSFFKSVMRSKAFIKMIFKKPVAWHRTVPNPKKSGWMLGLLGAIPQAPREPFRKIPSK